MENLDEDFADLVRARLEELGKNAYALENELGLPRDALRNVIRRDKKRTEPTIGRAKLIADALGLSFGWGHPDKTIIVDALEQAATQEADTTVGFARVAMHDIELSAGSGAQNDSEASGSHLLFRRDWMRKIGVTPKDARLARVRGDSMQPMLFDRDVVLLDMSKTTLPAGRKRANGVHSSYLVAIERDGEARIKWAERPNESTLIIYSENGAIYRPEIYVRSEAEEIRIIGYVVWWCHTVRG